MLFLKRGCQLSICPCVYFIQIQLCITSSSSVKVLPSFTFTCKTNIGKQLYQKVTHARFRSHFSDNIDYGLEFARKFVDAPEQVQTYEKNEKLFNRVHMNLHNNEAGRQVRIFHEISGVARASKGLVRAPSNTCEFHAEPSEEQPCPLRYRPHFEQLHRFHLIVQIWSNAPGIAHCSFSLLLADK